jgi:hypothetical protein
VTCDSAVHRKHNVVFPQQELLREHATVMGMCIAYLVTIRSIMLHVHITCMFSKMYAPYYAVEYLSLLYAMMINGTWFPTF